MSGLLDSFFIQKYRGNIRDSCVFYTMESFTSDYWGLTSDYRGVTSNYRDITSDY